MQVPAYLHQIGARPSLPEYFKQVWQRLPFAFYHATYSVISKYARNILGVAWLAIRPGLNAVVYGVIFGLIMGARKPENYISFVIIGVFLYEYFSMSLNSGAKAIVGNEQLIKAISFPRITLVISSQMQQIINQAVVMTLAFIALIIFGNPISWSWLWIFPILAIYTVLNFGIALIVARVATQFRDFLNFLPFIVRLGLYASGTIFALENLLSDYPQVIDILALNPVHAALRLSRGAFLQEYQIIPSDWIVLGSWSLVLLIGGFFYFWKAEMRYGRK